MDAFGQFHPFGRGWPLINAGITAGEKLNVGLDSVSRAGSVRFELTGPRTVSRTDNTAPFTLFEDFVGQSLPAGSYQVSYTAYSRADGSGTAEDTGTATFTLVSDTTAPSVSLACGNKTAVSSDLTLIGIDISEPVPGFGLEDEDIAFTNVRNTDGILMVSQRYPSGAWIYELAVEPEPTGGETTVMVPAGVGDDEAGNANTASNTLHIARNRKLSVADASATEGSGQTIDFDVTLDFRNDCKTVTVDWATEDGTATAGEDYTADSGRLTFAPGETSKTVSIAVLDDEESESDETFTLSLSNASGATFADDRATGTAEQRSARWAPKSGSRQRSAGWASKSETNPSVAGATGTIQSNDTAQQVASDTTPPPSPRRGFPSRPASRSNIVAGLDRAAARHDGEKAARRAGSHRPDRRP